MMSKIFRLLCTACTAILLGPSAFVDANTDVPSQATLGTDGLPPSESSHVFSSGVAPTDRRNRPHSDIVVAALVRGGDSQEAQDEIELVRKVYAKYGGQVTPRSAAPASAQPDVTALSLRLVFVVGQAGLPDDVELPPTGLLLGDFFHVKIQEGYMHLAEKTLAMMALSDHISFRFLIKVDADSYPCLSRMTHQLLKEPLERQPLLYAGSWRPENPVRHGKYEDAVFVQASAGTMKHYPPYHIGACYVLGERLVDHLNKDRDMRLVLGVEDAQVGMWLLGVKKVVMDLNGNFHCLCRTPSEAADHMGFFHHCKPRWVDECFNTYGAC